MRRLARANLILGLCAVTILIIPMMVAAELRPLYFGIQGGLIENADAELDSGFKRDMDLDGTWTAGLKLGYIIPTVKYLALEIEYFYSEQDFNPTSLIAVKGDITSHTFMLNLLGRYPIGKFIPYAGVGLGYSRFEINSTRVAAPLVSFSDDDFTAALQLRAGITFEITPHWSADLSYRYFWSEPALQNADIDIRNHIFMFGIHYHF